MSPPQGHDWAAMRAQLEEAAAAIDHGFTPSPDEEKRLLHERARLLAREPDAAPSGEMLEVAEFELAGERYGFLLETVRAVSALKELTSLPCVPPFISGIVNLRGKIRTVIDLKRFFDLPVKGITEAHMILLLEHDGVQLGILADAIRGVRTLASTELQPGLPTLTGRRADYLRGVTADRLIVLDAARLLADKRIIVDEQVEG